MFLDVHQHSAILIKRTALFQYQDVVHAIENQSVQGCGLKNAYIIGFYKRSAPHSGHGSLAYGSLQVL